MTFRFILLFSLVGVFQAGALPEVQVARPQKQSETISVTLPGRTEAWESARIFTRATGIVAERRFDIGDAVREGEVLAIVAVPELDRALAVAAASAEASRVRATNAQALAERAKQLLGANAISAEEADQRMNEALAQQAAATAAAAEVERLREVRGFATVRAPFSGIVVARNFERGDRVRGDSATSEGWLYQIARMDTLRFVVHAGPDVALRLDQDQAGEVQFGEFPNRRWSATVSRLSRSFDPTSGTMRVELTLPNGAGELPAGLTGTVRFPLSSPEGAWLVPGNCIQLARGQARLALAESGKLRFVDVRVGRNLGAQVEVFSPELQTNSAVILNPNAMLREGDAVEVLSPSR